MPAYFTTARLQKQLPAFASLLSSIMGSSPPSYFEPITNALPRSSYPDRITYDMYDFRRQDEKPDTSFYEQPRFVHHIDDAAISRLKKYYKATIRPEYSILDLCSSWTSHLPEDLRPAVFIGVGLNEAELKANKHLTSYHVRDLNERPVLQEVEDESVDVVICNVSIDYLTRPVDVVGEVRRVLKEGGTAHMAFSNRCFPTKVIGKWLRMDDEARRRWVGSYFWADNEAVGIGSEKGGIDGKSGRGCWVDAKEVVLNEGGYDDPLYVVKARKSGSIAT
ncbi:MAG: hypothetical protein M1818_004573 [Claussenomyces sp. TS43310]|nr:MAG: hypothetical protein M1818_004573 [Claussenomyces sp. TS43310]